MNPGSLDDLITWLGQLSTSDFRNELRKLRAIRDWAYEQAGIGFKEGDQVRIREGYAVPEFNRDNSANGWWGYRECLAGGARGTVTKIDFSPERGYWYAGFQPDREWAVYSEGHPARTIRHWHGPAADTPDGWVPPSPYDQDKYPDGRKHVFFMGVQDLEQAP